MDWTRRTVLRALGATVAAPVLLPLVHACRAGGDRPPGSPEPALRGVAEIRDQLREVVTDLSRRFGQASALAGVRRIGGAVVDTGERSVGHQVMTSLVLTVAIRERVFEEATADLGAAGITRAADALRARAAATYQPSQPPRPLAAPRNHALVPARGPGAGSTLASAPGAWLAGVEHLHARARRVGGSQVVYRGAYVTVDDGETVFMGEGRDLAQRVVRTRAGVMLVAQGTSRGRDAGAARAGARLHAAEAAQGGILGLDALELPDAALAAAADRVLALVTPAPPPQGLMDVILAPDLAALILHRCVAPVLCADRWLAGEARARVGHAIGASPVTVIDDPTAPDGYGSYAFDDEGQDAARVVLVDAGVLAAPLTDRRSARALGLRRTGHGRRAGAGEPAAPLPSNIALAPGPARPEALVAGIERGLLLEGGLLARTDPGTWRFVARAARAHEIRRGKLTGVLFGDLHVHGDVPGLLAAVQAVSAEPQRFCLGGGATVAASAASPFVWTQAHVSAHDAGG